MGVLNGYPIVAENVINSIVYDCDYGLIFVSKDNDQSINNTLVTTLAEYRPTVGSAMS